MDRRQLLLGLAFALGGPAALAACDSSGGDAILQSLRPDGRLHFHTRGEYRLIGLIADAVIPRTDTPGAIDAGVPAYADRMISTWASEETKTKHREGLKTIAARLKEIGGEDLHRLDDEHRRAAIAQLDAESYAQWENPEESVAAQYRGVKGLIAAIYYASEPGATQELQFELVPGRWLADAPLSEVGRTWAE